MAQLLDHIEYLSREIGPRPAGTEEEQQSALYIADQLQREAGFHAEIEEFTSSSNLEGARAIPSVVIVLFVILAMLFNILTVPALVLTLVAVAIYTLEAFDHPVLSKMLSRGASQNVVAKYQPGGEDAGSASRTRSRKVVLVAHYDSGKVKPRVLEMVDSLGLPIGLVVLGSMAVTALLLIVRIFVGGAGGIATIILNVLTIIALIVVAFPIAKAILNRVAPYNEAANNNASGVAAIIEVAHRISTGSASEADLAALSEEAVMHGEEAVMESGLVPQGVQVEYEQAPQPQVVDDFENYTEEERLLAAKAAIAALTGRPVESYVSEQRRAPQAAVSETAPAAPQVVDAQQAEGVAQAPTAPEPAPLPTAAPVASAPVVPAAAVAATVSAVSAPQAVEQPDTAEATGFQNAPSWFVAAQRNAKKPVGDASQAQRSRYTQAIESAEREAAARERVRAEEERIRREEATLASIAASRNQEAAPEANPAPTYAAVEVPAVLEDRRESAPAAYDAAPSEPVASAQPEAATALPEPAVPAPEPVAQEEPVALEVAAPEPAAFETPEASSADTGEAQPPVDLGSTVAYKPIRLEDMGLLEQVLEQPVDEAAEAPAEANPLAGIPQIEPEEVAQASAPENENPSRSGMFRKLRADVPSLSGVIRMQEAGEDVAQAPARSARPASAASLQSAVPTITVPEAGRPVGPLKDAVDYDMDVPDFGDQTVAIPQIDNGSAPERPQETPTGQGQVDMPSSRKDGFLSRRRSKNDASLEETPQEWLDVDKDFDARTVGRERGGWESFRNDSDGNPQGESSSERWQGGGFSRVHLDYVNTRSGDGESADTPEELVESAEDRMLNEEIGQIIHFRNPQYNTEIWFVAIGSDTELHDGAKAFVNEHRSELRGAMVIEVESLGAGALSVASEEGQFRTTKASSRVKRYTRPATEATGIVLDEAKIIGSDSITTTIQKAGLQAMHLFGAENGKPALKGSADDVLENIDELTLEENVNFLMELLKHN